MQRLIVTAALALTMSAGVSHAQTAAWSSRTTIDPITDARRGIASIESREEITRGISSDEVLNTRRADMHDSARYMLVVKCDYQSRGVYVSLLTPRGVTRSSSTITQRFDSAPPTSAVWKNSSASASLFNDADVAAFVTQARRANRIAMRIASTNGGAPEDTVTFSGSGAARAIASVYAACGQSLPNS